MLNEQLKAEVEKEFESDLDAYMEEWETALREKLLADVQEAKGAPPAALLEVPDVRQPNDFACGAAAAMSVARYFNTGPESLDEWTKALNTTEEEGTSPQAIIGYLKELGLAVEARDGMTVDDLIACWQAGKPVIVLCQDYMSERVERDDLAEWTAGHYLIFVGALASAYLVFQDSLQDDCVESSGSDAAPGKVLIRTEDFDRLWYDEGADGTRYVRFGIVVGK